tara:strand:- start:2781 stop:3365 length:585 start_codon:yes stop_codon:yes gene_type:complete
MKPIIISGKIGSGKSTLCRLFQEKGYLIIYSDLIAKKLIADSREIQDKLIKYFDTDVVDNGAISLNKLRSILCMSRKNKEIIDSIVHPIFFKELHRILQISSNNKIVVEIPLIETCKSIEVEYTLVFVNTNKEVRESRYLINNEDDRDIFNQLDSYQINSSASMKIADHIITNNDTMDELVLKFNQLYENLNYE